MFQKIFILWPLVVFPIIGLLPDKGKWGANLGPGILGGVVLSIVLFIIFKFFKNIFSEIKNRWNG